MSCSFSFLVSFSFFFFFLKSDSVSSNSFFFFLTDRGKINAKVKDTSQDADLS